MAGRHSVSSDTRGRIVVTVMRAAASVTGYGDEWTALCVACGEQGDRRLPVGNPDRIVMGHVVSDAHGGAYAVSNLRPTCEGCNDSMGETDMTDVLTPKYDIPNVPLVSARDAAQVKAAGQAAVATARRAKMAKWTK